MDRSVNPEILLKTLQKEAPVGLGFISLDFRYLEVNDWLARMNGRSRESHVGVKVEEVLPKMGRQIVLCLRKVKKTNTAIIDEEIRGERPSAPGVLKVWLISFYPIRNNENQTIMIGTITKDVTAHKKAESELWWSREELRRLVETVPDALVKVSQRGIILQVNLAATEVFGFKEGDEMYKGMGARVTTLDGKKIMKTNYPYCRVFRTGKTIKGVRMMLEYEDERKLAIEVASAPVFDEQGVVVQAVSMIRDISTIVEEEKRREYFTGIIGHELKNPLAAMKIMAQVLQSRLLKAGIDDLAPIAEKIDGKIDLLTGLINGLLDATKIGAGKLNFSVERFSLDDLVHEVVDEYTSIQKTHKMEMVGKSNVFVKADRQRIRQVLNNLLSNAVKYSPDKNKIRVEMVRNDKEVVVSVIDYGIGIAQKEQKRIFDMYYQSEKGRRYRMGGMGIGLFIAREIVWKHKGKMWVNSRLGKGSTFGFSLPVVN